MVNLQTGNINSAKKQLNLCSMDKIGVMKSVTYEKGIYKLICAFKNKYIIYSDFKTFMQNCWKQNNFVL